MRKFLLVLLMVSLITGTAYAVDDLDATVPANNSLISTFATYERETRAKVNEIIDNIPDIASWEVVTVAHTAASGDKLLVNTSDAACTVTLPASPTAGSYVQLADAKGTWATYNVTLGRNGSNIFGTASDYTLSTSGVYVAVYVDASYGWVVRSGIGTGLSSTLFTLSSYTQTNLADVITAIGTTPGILVIDKDITLSTSASIPATLRIYNTAGSLITVASTKVLTFVEPSQVLSGEQQIFSTSASTQVVFTRPGTVRPAWWGGIGDGSTECHAAIEYACASLPDVNPIYLNVTAGRVQLGTGTYKIGEKVTCGNAGMEFSGETVGGTRIKCTGITTGPCLEFTRQDRAAMQNWVDVGNFHLDSYDTNGDGIYFGPGEKQRLHDVWLYKAVGGYGGYGVKFDGDKDNASVWTSIAVVDRVRASGWAQALYADSAGFDSITNSIFEYSTYGVYNPCNSYLSGATWLCANGNLGSFHGNYIQSCTYGIMNTGSYATIDRNNFEGNTVMDYDDNASYQVHNTLMHNTWSTATLSTNFYPKGVRVSQQSTVLDKLLPNQLSGWRNAGDLWLNASGTDAYGPSLHLSYAKPRDDNETRVSTLTMTVTNNAGGTATDIFGQTPAVNAFNNMYGAFGGPLRELNIGTTSGSDASWPVNIWTGGVKRLEVGDDNITMNLLYGSDTFALDFGIWGGDETDPWGMTGTSNHISAWGPVHSILSRTDGLRIGPIGYSAGPHLLWYTAFMGYSPSNAWYAPMTINGNGVHIKSANVPASATAGGYAGQVAFDGNETVGYIYFCISDNKWIRAQLATW